MLLFVSGVVVVVVFVVCCSCAWHAFLSHSLSVGSIVCVVAVDDVLVTKRNKRVLQGVI